MKKCAVFLLLFLFLSGCTEPPDEMETGLELRSRLLQASQCTFTAEITADYGDKVHIFSMDCRTDPKGTVTFTVTKPDTISGISGSISETGGVLAFDDKALHFGLLTEKQLSPISAPWIVMKTLRSGCMVSAGTENDTVRLSIDDTYEKDPLRLDIWLNARNDPEHADILYDGRRILSVAVENFEIL